jgi:hypothetical protein
MIGKVRLRQASLKFIQHLTQPPSAASLQRQSDVHPISAKSAGVLRDSAREKHPRGG